MRLKTSLDHLPLAKQAELARCVDILHEEFTSVLALATSDWKRQGRIFHIILFGSFARGGWVEDRASGYMSDFDLLIIVNDRRLTDIVDYWAGAEDRLLHDKQIGRQVNFIVHTLHEVNSALVEGKYFFCDIIREGISLHEMKGAKSLIAPKPPDAETARREAEAYFERWMGKTKSGLKGARFYLGEGELNDAAFLLHQMVERAYGTLLLTHTLYMPPTHNIEFLRSLAEDIDARLIPVWPREKPWKRYFQLLKRAYVEARYSEHFTITPEELDWLFERAEALLATIDRLCREKLAETPGTI